jgi:hypothetical protein
LKADDGSRKQYIFKTKTEDQFSLTVFFNDFSPGLITFTVTGFFRERFSVTTSNRIRYFNRNFLLAKSASGVAIVNDILFVTVPMKEQLKVLF